MKKIRNILSLLVVFICSCFALASCGKDSDGIRVGDILTVEDMISLAESKADEWFEWQWDESLEDYEVSSTKDSALKYIVEGVSESKFKVKEVLTVKEFTEKGYKYPFAKMPKDIDYSSEPYRSLPYKTKSSFRHIFYELFTEENN